MKYSRLAHYQLIKIHFRYSIKFHGLVVSFRFPKGIKPRSGDYYKRGEDGRLGRLLRSGKPLCYKPPHEYYSVEKNKWMRTKPVLSPRQSSTAITFQSYPPNTGSDTIRSFVVGCRVTRYFPSSMIEPLDGASAIDCN